MADLRITVDDVELAAGGTDENPRTRQAIAGGDTVLSVGRT